MLEHNSPPHNFSSTSPAKEALVGRDSEALGLKL
jgi:hypothetical protein